MYHFPHCDLRKELKERLPFSVEQALACKSPYYGVAARLCLQPIRPRITRPASEYSACQFGKSVSPSAKSVSRSLILGVNMVATEKAHSPSGETSRSNFGPLLAREYRARYDGPKLAATVLEPAQPFRKRGVHAASDIVEVECALHPHVTRERVDYVSGYYHHAPCPPQCARWPAVAADRFNSQPYYPSSHCSQVGHTRSFAPRGPFIVQLPVTSASMTTTIQMVPRVAPRYSWAPSQACWRPKPSTRRASPHQTRVQDSSPWSPDASFRDASSPPAPMPDTSTSPSFQCDIPTARPNAQTCRPPSAHVDTTASLEAASKVAISGSQLTRQVKASLMSPLATKKRIRHAPFPKKLYEIVTANPGVVTWHEESRALIVRDPRRLSAEIMPRYFNTNGGDGILKSFTRQLNYYGFHRVSLHMTKTPAANSSPALPIKERGAIEDPSPFLLLNLRGSQVASCVQEDRLLTGRRNWNYDAAGHFFRNYFGNEALVFVNKDRTIKEPADFSRLIRFEKAASRIALQAR